MDKPYKSEKNAKITISDVAKKAGVAVATVSRVINNKHGVSAETRNKVLGVMMELNYVPSNAARILGGKVEKELISDLNSVGLIISESLKDNPYYMPILNGIESELHSEGYSCIYTQLNNILNNDSNSEKYYATSQLFNKSIGGFISVGIYLDKEVEILNKINKPIVFVDSINLGDDLNYVQANNTEGAVKAISYLISLGHKRIALIRDDWNFWFFNDLKKGYLEVLWRNNIEIDKVLISKGLGSSESIYQQTIKLLSLENPPTAFFSNDKTISIGVMKAIKDKCLKIPQDISVIGFDNIDTVKYLDPPLTTVHVPKSEIGMIAAKKINELIKNGTNTIPTRILLPTRLVLRESTGPVSSKV